WLPTSRSCTHSVPAVVSPASCADAPAAVLIEAPVSCVQPASLTVPIARPITTVAGGAAAVRVASVTPVAATRKLLNALPPTGAVPENVSVVRVTLGVVVDEDDELLPHPATDIATLAASAAQAIPPRRARNGGTRITNA